MILAKNIRKVAREYGTNIKEISKQLGVLSNNLSRTINSPNMTVEDLQNRVSNLFNSSANYRLNQEYYHSNPSLFKP